MTPRERDLLTEIDEAEAIEAVISRARTVVLNAHGTSPRHTRDRDGGCRDDCFPCGIAALNNALITLDRRRRP